jgi:hypothetical protein
MQNPATDYRQLADGERLAADAATLANVRQKHLSAAEVWDSLAERQERIADLRAARALGA